MKRIFSFTSTKMLTKISKWCCSSSFFAACISSRVVNFQCLTALCRAFGTELELRLHSPKQDVRFRCYLLIVRMRNLITYNTMKVPEDTLLKQAGRTAFVLKISLKIQVIFVGWHKKPMRDAYGLYLTGVHKGVHKNTFPLVLQKNHGVVRLIDLVQLQRRPAVLVIVTNAE